MSTRKWEPPRPSTYTPFFRRFFVDEKTREVTETKQLYKKVTERFAASEWGDGSALKVLFDDIIDRVEEYGGLPSSVRNHFIELIKGLLVNEDYLFPIEEPKWPLLLEEQVEFRAQLRHQEYFLTHKDKCADAIVHGIAVLVSGISGELEIDDDVAHPIVTSVVPMYTLLNTNDVIESIINTFVDIEKYATFTTVVQQLYLNLCAVSNIQPDTNSTKSFVLPSKKKLEPADAIAEYLHHTPFFDLLNARMPLEFEITEHSYFEHMHVVGGTGAGKTQWLGQLILRHLKTDNSIVVVDSQNHLIPRLSTLKEYQDRIVYVDPDRPPAIRLFDGGAAEAFDYLFGMFGADLTPKQAVFFRFVARLMTSVSNAGLMDMLKIMEDITPYQKYIDKLPEVQQNFFHNDFNANTFNQTKEQVKYRLNMILENPILQKMFEPGDTLDLKDAIDSGKMVLIDTNKDILGGASSYYGRIFIFLILKTVFLRDPKGYCHPTHLIIDEAQEYLDQNIDDLLTQARKYKLGLTMAHQYLGQCTQKLRESLSANTSIKMVSGVNASDARALAPDLRTTADFILAQPQLTFATYVRNYTKSAISLPVTPGLVDNQQHVIRKKTSKKKPQPEPKPEPQDGGKDVDTGAGEVPWEW